MKESIENTGGFLVACFERDQPGDKYQGYQLRSSKGGRLLWRKRSRVLTGRNDAGNGDEQSKRLYRWEVDGI